MSVLEVILVAITMDKERREADCLTVGGGGATVGMNGVLCAAVFVLIVVT